MLIGFSTSQAQNDINFAEVFVGKSKSFIEKTINEVGAPLKSSPSSILIETSNADFGLEFDLSSEVCIGVIIFSNNLSEGNLLKYGYEQKYQSHVYYKDEYIANYFESKDENITTITRWSYAVPFKRRFEEIESELNLVK